MYFTLALLQQESYEDGVIFCKFNHWVVQWTEKNPSRMGISLQTLCAALRVDEGLWPCRTAWRGQRRQEAEATRWWPATIANVILRTNWKRGLHAAFLGPSKVPWQRFSQLYWYQKGCQEGFHGPNVREMAQNMITGVTDRLQQLPLRGANWYPMVGNQDSHGQLLQIRDLKPHRKNVETSPIRVSVKIIVWQT